MIRKLLIVLLSGALCLLVAAPLLAETNWGWSTLQEYEEVTGNKIEEFNEAPELRLKVAAGELPPIEERLPEEPLVDKPFDEVGTYGGTLRLAMLSMTFCSPAELRTIEYMLNLDRDVGEAVPNIAKGWEFSDEGKTFTLYLRKGMKWSDGAPFTADDILFYWEAVVLNDEITPVKPKHWMPGGKLMTVEKVDDYTVSFHFSKPYWSIIWILSGAGFRGGQNYIFLPKHTLKKYHIDYNPEADELAKEEGYDHWWQLLNVKRHFDVWAAQRPDIPSVAPWVVTKVLPEGMVFERNPYYFKIDTAGNQLPYIDTIKATLFGNAETLVLKMTSGEYDYMDLNWTTPKDYPVLMEEAERGGYYVWLLKSLRGNAYDLFFNQNYDEDPAIGGILRDVEFRRALSLAINREEINEVCFLEKGTPRQATVHPSCSFYKEEWATMYAEYDPEGANQLLDEMGLDKRDKDGYRLRADGKPLHIVMSVATSFPSLLYELVKEYWEEVGVKTTVNPLENAYLHSLWYAGKYMISSWGFGATAEPAVAAGMLSGYLSGRAWAPQWEAWWQTNGEKGEEPPDEVKRIWSLYDEVPYLSEEESSKALQEVFDIWADNLWYLGIVGMISTPSITNINLKNVDTDTYTGMSVGYGTYNRLYQAFWKK